MANKSAVRNELHNKTVLTILDGLDKLEEKGYDRDHFKRVHGGELPEITFNLKGKTAGQVRYWHSGSQRTVIRYNLDIACAPENFETFLTRTVPHEVAHLLALAYFPQERGHGRYWKYVMRLLGVPANEITRCHDYSNVKSARKSMKYAYACGCDGKEHWVSSIRHNRSQSDHTRYHCTVCRTTITWTGKEEERY